MPLLLNILLALLLGALPLPSSCMLSSVSDADEDDDSNKEDDDREAAEDSRASCAPTASRASSNCRLDMRERPRIPYSLVQRRRGQ